MAQSLPNPHLALMENDKLHHLGYSTTEDLKALFGDVKFVCVGGSANRMMMLTTMLHDEFSIPLPATGKPENICKTERFVMYKVGPVLASNHHIGGTSVTIVLHELIKLLYYAGCVEPIFIRIGTSGGVGIPPGTIVITDRGYDEQLKNQHIVTTLGKFQVTDAVFDKDLAEEIQRHHTEKSHDVIIGSTLAIRDFYEGMGRLDGAVCEHGEEERLAFHHKLQELGIKNIEKEATSMSSLCKRANRQAAMVCVILADRLSSDRIQLTPETYKEYNLRPLRLVTTFIKHRLKQACDGHEAKTD